MNNLFPFGPDTALQSCTTHSFTYPSIFGTQITSLSANLVSNYSLNIAQGWYVSHAATNVSNLVFCNVSIEYTHPGYGDNINTQVWLPIGTDWNGRLQGSGGVGFATGLIPSGMAGAVADGYAVVSTDGGHVVDPAAVDWYLSSEGNVNWILLQNYADTAVKEAGEIGKIVVEEFYGMKPRKSYWIGCSNGGRQGLAMAQRYPGLFDGILAAAPGINLPKIGVAEHYPQILMQQAGEFPAPCEFEAITAAAIEACDELDGVKDGILSAPELCNFNATPLIGKTIDCPIFPTGKTRISSTAVLVAESIWTGFRDTDNSFLWHGLNHDAPLTGPTMMANTICSITSSNTTTCHLPPASLSIYWLRYLLFRSPTHPLSNLTHTQLITLFHASHARYSSILSMTSPHLQPFSAHGGKMITWHGLADEILMPNMSREYYASVADTDPTVAEYYRYFEVPGVAHCMGGKGPYPDDAFERLVEWVENGNAPDVLTVRGWRGDGDGDGERDGTGRVMYEREVCAWPKRQVYIGGDGFRKESFECV